MNFMICFLVLSFALETFAYHATALREPDLHYQMSSAKFVLSAGLAPAAWPQVDDTGAHF